MPANFAMPVPVPSTSGDEEALTPGAGALAARVAAGPGSLEGEEWLADLRRESLLESLMSDGAVAAAASAEHGHKLERALNAEVTALSLACGALFPVLGYDAVLALVFGLPGVPVRPGTPVPTGPAYSKARERSGEAPARAMFFRDAARTDIPQARTAPRSAWNSPRSTAPPWNCSATRGSRTSSASRLPPRSPCCGSSGCCTPAPAAGAPP